MSEIMNKLKIKHKHHNTRTVYGSWGPHRAKIICEDCGGAFVSWCKSDHTEKPQGETMEQYRTYSYHKHHIHKAQTVFMKEYEEWKRYQDPDSGSWKGSHVNRPCLFSILETVFNEKDTYDAVRDTLELKDFLKSRK